MAIERSFSIIKPDATTRNLTGAINAVIEKAGLRIIAQRRLVMTRGQAECVRRSCLDCQGSGRIRKPV